MNPTILRVIGPAFLNQVPTFAQGMRSLNPRNPKAWNPRARYPLPFNLPKGPSTIIVGIWAPDYHLLGFRAEGLVLVP